MIKNYTNTLTTITRTWLLCKILLPPYVKRV